MIRFLAGDCRERLKDLSDQSVQCVVTSPPYFGLRDYGTADWTGGDPRCDHANGRNGATRRDISPERLAERAALYGTGTGIGSSVPPQQYRDSCGKCGAVRTDSQIGLEASPAVYVAEMVAVFREVWRVLRDDGTVWLNLGDSYAATGKSGGGSQGARWDDHGAQTVGPRGGKWSPAPSGFKPKDLMMIPARVAVALQDDGWYLRKDIIWAKPNPMPESATDRPTSSHEHVFLLTKRQRYFYDSEAIAEPSIRAGDVPGGGNGFVSDITGGHNKDGLKANGMKPVAANRNARDVWTIATMPYPDAHFAVMPAPLAERCILAGTSERGACPKCGAPWARIIIKGEPDAAHRAACGANASGGYNGQSIKNHDAAGVQNASDVKRRILDGMREKTYGWQQTCACLSVDPVPCVVLDPFSGAGTTALVADRMGRDAIGIDLNPTYGVMARERLVKDAGMFAEFGA